MKHASSFPAIRSPLPDLTAIAHTAWAISEKSTRPIRAVFLSLPLQRVILWLESGGLHHLPLTAQFPSNRNHNRPNKTTPARYHLCISSAWSSSDLLTRDLPARTCFAPTMTTDLLRSISTVHSLRSNDPHSWSPLPVLHSVISLFVWFGTSLHPCTSYSTSYQSPKEEGGWLWQYCDNRTVEPN